MRLIRLSGLGREIHHINPSHVVMVTGLSAQDDRPGASVLLQTGTAVQVRESVEQILGLLEPPAPVPVPAPVRRTASRAAAARAAEGT